MALLKYGHANFSLEILEYHEVELLLSKEQFYIDLIEPDYNILKTAGSSFGYKHSPEAIEKIRAASLARKVSAETIEKMSEALLGNKNSLGKKWYI